MENRTDFHQIRYLLSTYIWVAVLAIFLVIPVAYPYKNKMKGFEPKNIQTNWDLETDPITFAHLSDIHINHVVPSNNEKFEIAKNWTQKVKPTWTVITGDLCDDFPMQQFPKYGYQQPEDWVIYNKMIENYSVDESFIEVAGNHDEFGVFEYDSDNHNFLKGRKKMTEDEFKVSKLVRDYYNGTKLHMIKLAPFLWPSAHPCFVFWPKEDKHFLDLVEKSLEDVGEKDTVIFFCHYPLNLFEDGKSSKVNSMKDLVSKPGSQRYFLSGHLHPSNAYFQHQGNGFEAVAPALKVKGKFGFFTLDHGRFVYQTISNKNLKEYYVTSPVPDNLLTPNTPFSENKGYIRVRALTAKMPNISISGDVTGQMNCRNVNSVNETGYVCSYPYDLANGKYSISFDGDMKGEKLSFRIGVKSDDINELEYSTSHWHHYIAIMIVFWIFVAFIVIPFPMKFQFIEDHEDFLVGNSAEGSWLTTTLGSLLLFKARVNSLPLWFKIVLIVAAFYPLCLPTTFIEIDGHAGFIFTYGYVCGGKYLYALWGQIHTMIYLFVTVYPVMLAAQSSLFSKPFKPVFIVDIVACVCLIGVDIYIIIRNICESAGFTRAWLSPLFVIIPIILWICVVVLRFLPQKPKTPFDPEPLLTF